MAVVLLVLLFFFSQREPFATSILEVEDQNIKTLITKPSVYKKKYEINGKNRKDLNLVKKEIFNNSTSSLTHLTQRPENPDDLSWFYHPLIEGMIALGDPKYEKHLLNEAKTGRKKSNLWQEDSFKPMDYIKEFSIKIRPLKNLSRMMYASIKLNRDENLRILFPEWIKFFDQENIERTYRYTGFESKYVNEELYLGLLSFPYDSFWKKISPESKCEEIAVIYDSLGSHEDRTTLSSFDARVFCRSGLENMRGIGHLSAHVIE